MDGVRGWYAWMYQSMHADHTCVMLASYMYGPLLAFYPQLTKSLEQPPLGLKGQSPHCMVTVKTAW